MPRKVSRRSAKSASRHGRGSRGGRILIQFSNSRRQLTPSLPDIAVRRTASLPLAYARQSIFFENGLAKIDGCPGHLARRRASRFCPGMTNVDISTPDTPLRSRRAMRPSRRFATPPSASSLTTDGLHRHDSSPGPTGHVARAQLPTAMASATTIGMAATADVIRIPAATATGRAVVMSLVADASVNTAPITAVV